MSRAAVVDYGSGNVFSVCQALVHCGAEVALVDTPSMIAGSERLILPGVGAFGECRRLLALKGLIEAVINFANSGRPLLGICVGMQMLFDVSEEFGETAGLGLVEGRVVRLPTVGADGVTRKIPHIGWNALQPGASWTGTILAGLTAGDRVYFVHSFAGHARNPRHTLATTDYGGHSVCAAVRRDNIYGCQFHPEKSGPTGLAILANFLAL